MPCNCRLSSCPECMGDYRQPRSKEEEYLALARLDVSRLKAEIARLTAELKSARADFLTAQDTIQALVGERDALLEKETP